MRAHNFLFQLAPPEKNNDNGVQGHSISSKTGFVTYYNLPEEWETTPGVRHEKFEGYDLYTGNIGPLDTITFILSKARPAGSCFPPTYIVEKPYNWGDGASDGDNNQGFNAPQFSGGTNQSKYPGKHYVEKYPGPAYEIRYGISVQVATFRTDKPELAPVEAFGHALNPHMAYDSMLSDDPRDYLRKPVYLYKGENHQSSFRSANYVYTENYNCTYLGAEAENIVDDGGAWESQKHSMDMVSPSHATCYASEIPFFMNQFAMTASDEGGENAWMAGKVNNYTQPNEHARGMKSKEGYDLRYFTEQEGSYDYGTEEINYGYGSINLETLQNCFYLPYDGSKKATGQTSAGAHDDTPEATQNFSSSGKLRISITPHAVPIFNENAGCIGAYDLVPNITLGDNYDLIFALYGLGLHFDKDWYPDNLNAADELKKQKIMAMFAGPFSSRLDEIAMHPWLVPQSMNGTGECYDILHDIQGPMQFIDPDYAYGTYESIDYTGSDLGSYDIGALTYMNDSSLNSTPHFGGHNMPQSRGSFNDEIEDILKQGFAHPATMIPRKNTKYAELQYFRDIQNVAWLETNGQVDRYVYEFDVAAAPERINTSQPVSFNGLKDYLADSPFAANDAVKINGDYSSSITDDNRFLPQKNISMANDKLRSHLKFAKTLYNDESSTLADDATISDLLTSAAGGISADDFRGQFIYKDSINRLDSLGGNTSHSMNPNDDFTDAQYRFAYPRQHRPAVDTDAKDPGYSSELQPYDNEYYNDRPIPIIPGSYPSVLGGAHKPNPAFLTKGGAAFFTIDPGEGNMTVGNRANTAVLNNNYGLPTGHNLSNTKYYGYISADGGSWLYNDESATLTNGQINNNPNKYGINLPNYYPEFYKPKIGQYCDEFIEYSAYRDRTGQSHLHANALINNPDPYCEWFGRWDNVMDNHLQQENLTGTNAANIDNNHFNTLGYYTAYDTGIDEDTNRPGGVHYYGMYNNNLLSPVAIPPHTEWEWRKSHNQNEDLSGWQAPEIYAMYWAPITPSLKGDGFFEWPSFTIMVEGTWQKDDFKQLTISSGTKAHQQHTYRTDWKCDHQIIQTGAYFQSIQESADEDRSNVLNDARPKAPITVWRWGYESKLETTPEHSKDSKEWYGPSVFSNTNYGTGAGSSTQPHKHPLFSRRPEYLSQSMFNTANSPNTGSSTVKVLLRKAQKAFCDMGTWKPITVHRLSDVEWSGTNPDININPFLVNVEDQIAQGLPSTLHNKVTCTMYQKEDPFYGIAASSAGPHLFQSIKSHAPIPEVLLSSKPKNKTLKLPSAKEASRLSGRQWISGTYAFSYENPTYDQISSDSIPNWVPDTFDNSNSTSRPTITGFGMANVSEEFQSPGQTITDNFFYANEPTGSTWPNGSGMTNNIHLRYNGFYVDTTKALAIRPLSGTYYTTDHPSGDKRQHVGETFAVNQRVLGQQDSRLEVLDDIGNTYLLQAETRIGQFGTFNYTFEANNPRFSEQREGNQVEAIETEDGNFEDSSKWTYYTGGSNQQTAAVFPDSNSAPFDGDNPNSVYYSQGMDIGSADDNVAYDSSLTYKWYNLINTTVQHATNEAEMDSKFNDSSGNVTLGGTGQWNTAIAWHETGGTHAAGSQIKPEFLPDSTFSLEISGTITAPETGTYTFKSVSDDSSDVFIDSINVVNHYGGHGLSYPAAPDGAIDLEAGRTYNFRTRMQENTGGDGQMLFWKKPSDDDFQLIPISAFYKGGNVTIGAARDTMAVSNYADVNFENGGGTWLNSTAAALYTAESYSNDEQAYEEIANPAGLDTSNGSACLVLSARDVSSDWGPNVDAERFNFGRTNYPGEADGSYRVGSTYSQNTLTFNAINLEIAVGRRLAFHGSSAYVNAQNNVFTAVISKVVYNSHRRSFGGAAPYDQKIIVFLDNVEVLNPLTINDDSTGQPILLPNWFNPTFADDIDFIGNLDNYPSDDYIGNSVAFKAIEASGGNIFAEGGHWRGEAPIDYTTSVAGIVPSYYYSFGKDLDEVINPDEVVINPAEQDKFLLEGSIYLHDPGEDGHPPNGTVYLGVAAYNQADGDPSSNIGNIQGYTDGSQWWYPVRGMNTNNLQTNKWYHFSFPFRLTDANGINDNVNLGQELKDYGPALPWNASAIRAVAILNYLGTEGKMYAQNVRIRRINSSVTFTSDSTDIRSFGIKRLAHQTREHNSGIYDPMLPTGWLTGNMYDYREGIHNTQDSTSNNYEILDFNGAPEIFRNQNGRNIHDEMNASNEGSNLFHAITDDHYTDATLSELGKPWVDTPNADTTAGGINVGTTGKMAMWHVADGQQLPGMIFTETRFQGNKISIANDADFSFNTLSANNESFFNFNYPAAASSDNINTPHSGEMLKFNPASSTPIHTMTAEPNSTLEDVKTRANFYIDGNLNVSNFRTAVKAVFENFMYPGSHEDDTIGDFSTRTKGSTLIAPRGDTRPSQKNMALNDWSLTTGLIDNKAHHGSDSLRYVKNAIPYTLDRPDGSLQLESDGVNIYTSLVNIEQLTPDITYWLDNGGFAYAGNAIGALAFTADSGWHITNYYGQNNLSTAETAAALLIPATASQPLLWPYGVQYFGPGSTSAADKNQSNISQQMYSRIAANAFTGPDNTVRGSLDSSRYFHKKSYTAESWYEEDQYTIHKNKMNRYLTISDDYTTHTNKYDELTREIVTEDWGGQTSASLESLGHLPHLKSGLHWNLMRKVKLKTKVGRRVVISFRIYNHITTQDLAITNPMDRLRAGSWWVKYHKDGDPTFRPNTWIRNVEARHTGPGTTQLARVTSQTTTSTQANNLITPNPSYTGWIEFEYETAAATGASGQAYLYDVNRPLEHTVATSTLNPNQWYQCSVSIEITQEMLGSNIDLAFYAAGGRIEDIPLLERDNTSGIIQGVTVEISENQMEDD